MPKIIIIMIFLIFLLSFAVIADSPYNFLTKGLADTLYCRIDGSNGCGGSGGGVHKTPLPGVASYDHSFNFSVDAEVHKYEIQTTG